MRRRKSKSDEADAVRVLAVMRATIGLGLFVAPVLSTRLWMGRRPDVSGKAAMRSLGAREVALGVGTLTALERGAPVRGWLEAGVLSDVVDAGNALFFFRGVGGFTRLLATLGPTAAAWYGAQLAASTEKR